MLDELFEAVFGVDFKVGRTLRDTILHPVRVAEADIDPEDHTYTPQIRLFIALIGFQILLSSALKIYSGVTLEELHGDPADLAAVSEALAAHGATIAEVDETILDWINYSFWPATIIGTLIYVGVMKALRPALKITAHLRIYLTAANASYLLSLPVMLMALLPGDTGQTASLIAAMVMLAAFVVYLLPLMRRWYAHTLTGQIIKTFLMLLLMIPFMIIATTLMFLAIDFGVKRQFGIGFFEIIAISADNPPTHSNPGETPS